MLYTMHPVPSVVLISIKLYNEMYYHFLTLTAKPPRPTRPPHSPVIVDSPALRIPCLVLHRDLLLPPLLLLLVLLLLLLPPPPPLLLLLLLLLLPLLLYHIITLQCSETRLAGGRGL